jgi:hypothetical protein
MYANTALLLPYVAGTANANVIAFGSSSITLAVDCLIAANSHLGLASVLDGLQPDDLPALRSEVAERQMRLASVQYFLASVEARPSRPSPDQLLEVPEACSRERVHAF